MEAQQQQQQHSSSQDVLRAHLVNLIVQTHVLPVRGLLTLPASVLHALYSYFRCLSPPPLCPNSSCLSPCTRFRYFNNAARPTSLLQPTFLCKSCRCCFIAPRLHSPIPPLPLAPAPAPASDAHPHATDQHLQYHQVPRPLPPSIPPLPLLPNFCKSPSGLCLDGTSTSTSTSTTTTDNGTTIDNDFGDMGGNEKTYHGYDPRTKGSTSAKSMAERG